MKRKQSIKTLKEAKIEANRIGGVVDWWFSYSVYTAPEWKAFNGTHGYGTYISKKAEKYFQAEWRKEKKAKAKEMIQWKKDNVELLLTWGVKPVIVSA